MAGAEGLEPSRTVLETAILPLHHAPIFGNGDIIAPNRIDVKHFLKKATKKAMPP